MLIVHNRGNPRLPSGEDVVVTRDAKALELAGAFVVVHRAQNSSEPTSFIDQARTGASLLWSRSGRQTIGALIDEHRPNVVHFHGVLPNLSASVFGAAQSAGVAVVQTLHNHRWLCVEGGLLRNGEFCDDCISKSPRAAIRHRCVHGSRIKTATLVANNLLHVGSGRLQRVVDRFVAVSEYVRDRHLDGGFPAAKLSIKYNNVDLLSPDRQTAKVSVHSQVPRVIFVGRLDSGKGADLLPPIFAALPNADLDIVGVGDLESSLRQQFDTAGCSARVTFHGRLDSAAVHQRLKAASVALIPSRAAETFGLVAAEAMAAATPFVCSNRGALAELARKSEGGRAVALEVTALAAATQAILGSPTRAKQLSVSGRAFAERELSLERGATRLLEIYGSLV